MDAEDFVAKKGWRKSLCSRVGSLSECEGWKIHKIIDFSRMRWLDVMKALKFPLVKIHQHEEEKSQAEKLSSWHRKSRSFWSGKRRRSRVESSNRQFHIYNSNFSRRFLVFKCDCVTVQRESEKTSLLFEKRRKYTKHWDDDDDDVGGRWREKKGKTQSSEKRMIGGAVWMGTENGANEEEKVDFLLLRIEFSQSQQTHRIKALKSCMDPGRDEMKNGICCNKLLFSHSQFQQRREWKAWTTCQCHRIGVELMKIRSLVQRSLCERQTTTTT